MNCANNCARHRIAIDVVNAMMVLIKLESKRFDRKKAIAWGSDDKLTPFGQAKRDKVLADINVCEYIIEIEEWEEYFACKVKKTSASGKLFYLRFPIKATLGSRFGTCTCGVPQVRGVPCKEHMAAVLKSGKIDGLNENNFMPSCWMIAQMKLQYPIDDMDIPSLKSRGNPDHHM